jgi:hypothetical protein
MDLLPPCLAWYELWKAHGYPSRRVWSHLAMSNNTVKKNNPTPYITLESTIINHRTNAVLTWRSCTAEHSIFGAWKPQAHNEYVERQQAVASLKTRGIRPVHWLVSSTGTVLQASLSLLTYFQYTLSESFPRPSILGIRFYTSTRTN